MTTAPTPLPPTWQNALRESARFWERGRWGYNLALAAVTLAWIGCTWPHFRPALTRQSALLLAVLALLANGCYCAAYPVDLALQYSAWRHSWQRHRRWLWIAGTAFAMLLACYWIADEIFPDFP